MITKIIDSNPITFNYQFSEFGIDEFTLDLLSNEAFKKELFFNSISNEITIEHYIYLLIKNNFYSEFNFKEYKGIASLKKIIERYFEIKLKSNPGSRSSISVLDKFILILASPKYDKTMELDHIFPLKEYSIPVHLRKRYNLNHPANLCYLSKTNNLKKSNILPTIYIQSLLNNNETELYNEFMIQTFWNDLISEKFNGEINYKPDFDAYLLKRSSRLIESLISKVGV